MRHEYEDWLEDEDILRHQALTQIQKRKRFERLENLESEEERLAAWIGGELPPLHVYRVPYNLGRGGDLIEADFAPDVWNEILRVAEDLKAKYAQALQSGEIDNRSPLKPVRRAWFQKRVEEFSAEDYPESIPQVFTEAECSVFGHICPIFFAAEGITETEEERRFGRRRLSFATMMRIVRRDDYRCQHCQKKMQDNEVEFDHISPLRRAAVPKSTIFV